MADEDVLTYTPTPPEHAEPRHTVLSARGNKIPTEHVPNEAKLYMRVHKMHVDSSGRLRPGAFRDHNGGMSTDWNKYSTAEDTRNRARVPTDNGVISLEAGGIRQNPRLRVEHTPYNTDPPHPRHVDVLGEKDAETRMHLLDLAHWEIPYRTAV